MGKAFVLISGGIDSTTCLHIAHEQFNGDIEGVSINYGQRHFKETEFAKKSCDKLGVPHRILDLSSIVPKTMLTDKDAAVPNISYEEITGVSPTYVPYRNGLLLSAITSCVHGEYERAKPFREDISKPMGEWGIYFGAHAEDAHNWAYPDCTPEFIGSMANAIHVGTYYAIRLHTPLQWLNKKQIIEWGESLNVDWAKTWSCYKGEELQCGVCPTCRARRKGFVEAGVKDPTVYQSDL